MNKKKCIHIKKVCVIVALFLLLCVFATHFDAPIVQSFYVMSANHNTNLNVIEKSGNGVDKDNDCYMHISFDDVEMCFNNLKNNSYSSLYDEPFFAWLKTMHDSYGAKFSLYVYNDILIDVSDKYSSEFFIAKDWLKFGLHATNSNSNFSYASYESGKNAWNSFVNNITRITGSYLSVDRMPRLHMFAGSEGALKGMRDANCGAIGFLSADDARNSYYLNNKANRYLYANDHVTDCKNGLIFVATDLRIDWFDGVGANYTYKKPTKSNVYDELVERYTNVEFANSTRSYIVFGHEWKIYDGTNISDMCKEYYLDVCRFANEYKIEFNYAQNHAFCATPFDIYPNDFGEAYYNHFYKNLDCFLVVGVTLLFCKITSKKKIVQ